MTIEKFKEAIKIKTELDNLQNWIDDCKHISSIIMYVEGDKVERASTVQVPISEELSKMIMINIKRRIIELENKFNDL